MFINKKELAKLIEKAVTKALSAEITIEKKRDDKTGQPLATPEIIKETVFLPAYICQILPYHEGALRGVQEQTCHHSNKVNDLDKKMELIGNVIVDAENSLKSIAHLSDNIKSLEVNEIKVIEDKHGKSNN